MMASLRRMLMVCAVLGVIAAASAVVLAENERATTQDVGAAAAQAASDYSVPGGLLVWMEPDHATLQPNGDQSADGTVFVRVTDAQGVAQTTKLGPGIDARLWAGGVEPVLVVERYDCSNHVFAYRQADAGWEELFALSEEPLAMGADGSTIVYTEIGESSTLVLRDKATGEEVLRSKVPAMEGYSDDAFGGISMPFAYDPIVAQACALVPVADHLFAFSTNGQACQITDEPSGLTKPVDGGISVRAACVAPDGRIYAVTEGFEKGDTVKVLGIDPATLKTVSVADTGWISSPVDGFPRLSRLQLLPTKDGVALWVVEGTANPEIVEPTYLWLLRDGKLAKSDPLPQRIGITAACGKDDSLLLYGGYARNVVARLDLSSGEIAPVKDMQAPESSWVLVAAD